MNIHRFISSFLIALVAVVSFLSFGRAQAFAADLYTGCLSAGAGVIYNAKLGSATLNPCASGDTEVLGGSGIIEILAGEGLSGGGDEGTVTLDLSDEFLAGWTATSGWTYASSTSFTVSGDQTGRFHKGTLIKLTQTTVKYFYVIGSSHSSGTTTVTVTGGSDYSIANAAITSPAYSYQMTPQGFPDWFNWSPSGVSWDGTAPTSPSQSTFKFTLKGKTCYFKAKREYSNAGSANAVVNFDLPIAPAGEASEYNVPGSGYISASSAGVPPTMSNHRSFIYGTSGGQFYILIDSGIAAKTFWASGFYEI